MFSQPEKPSIIIFCVFQCPGIVSLRSTSEVKATFFKFRNVYLVIMDTSLKIFKDDKFVDDKLVLYESQVHRNSYKSSDINLE